MLLITIQAVLTCKTSGNRILSAKVALETLRPGAGIQP